MKKTESAADNGVGQASSRLVVEPQTKKTYNLIRFFADTEIAEAYGDTGEYPTFQEAKAAAIDYLQEVVDLCEMRMEEIEEYKSTEDNFGTGPSEDLPLNSEGSSGTSVPGITILTPKPRTSPMTGSSTRS